MKLAINLTVIVPSAGEHARRFGEQAGDIVSSMSGQTIEILNTDAEGRLILCDAADLRRALQAENGDRRRDAHRRLRHRPGSRRDRAVRQR